MGQSLTKSTMAEVLKDDYPTINDLPDENLLSIIIIVLFDNPNMQIKLNRLYINRLFRKLIKENVYILPPNLKKEVGIQIPIPYSYICNKFAKNLLLKSVVISDSVTYIGHYAFSWCKLLTSIDIPNSVTHIGKGAFYACKSVVKIVIPNSVTYIGLSAFSYCDSLTSVKMPRSLEHLKSKILERFTGTITYT